MSSGMLKPRWLLTYFGHNSFCFLSFQNSRQMCSGGQGGGGQGGGRHGGGRQGRWRGKSHGCWDNIKCFLLTSLFVFYVWSKKLKFLLFQFMVWNLREVSLHYIIILPVKFRKTDVKVAEVKAAGVKVEVQMSGGWCWGRRGSGRGAWFKALHFKTKFQYPLTG